jgi:hypothetical protein
MRRLLLASFLLLWIAAPATALSMRPEDPFEAKHSLARSQHHLPPEVSVVGEKGWARGWYKGRNGKGPKPPWPPHHQQLKRKIRKHHYRDGVLPPTPGGGVTVPEPGLTVLLGLGLVTFGASRRSSRRQRA